jgi:hypothetical protein
MAVKWSNWASLGKPEKAGIGRPFVQHNQDGRLEVFAVGGGEIFNIWQVFPNAGWTDGWQSLASPSSELSAQGVGFGADLDSHVVGRNADGRLEIFARGVNVLWQKWQVAPNGGWSKWKPLGDTLPRGVGLTDHFTVGRNQDGRQEVFAVADDRADLLSVSHIWQTAPNGGWSFWHFGLGKPIAGIRRSDRITVGSNRDGRQELFVMGGDDALWHIWQVFPNAGWSDWESLGKPRDAFPEPKDRDISQPTVQKNADGHLEVFAPGNGAFCNRWQEMPLNLPINWRHEGWNAKPRPEVGLTWLDAAINVGGQLNNHLEVFALSDDGTFRHAWQIDQPPFWSTWESLGNPPPGIREADRLTIGTNQDGRLEVFVMGQDGAVWHSWQIR